MKILKDVNLVAICGSCSRSLGCMDEYLAINSSGYLCTIYSSRNNCCMDECLAGMSRWCLNEQFC